MGKIDPGKDLTFEQKVILDAIYRIDDLKAKRKMSKVKFEKLMFLLAKMYPSQLEEINDTFEPYAMGPFNEYLEDDGLGRLEDLGLIKDHKEITPEGLEIAKQNIQQDDNLKEIDKSLKQLIKILSPLSNNDILYITYNLYPKYAERSQVKHMAKSENFETYEVDLNEISKRPSETIEIKSDKGNRLKIKFENGVLEIDGKVD